jgi:hypothetical protein
VEEQTNAAELDSPDPIMKTKKKKNVTQSWLQYASKQLHHCHSANNRNSEPIDLNWILLPMQFYMNDGNAPVGTVPSTRISSPTGKPTSTPFDLAYS